jgi:prepilin-type N-terminal cleavage/methylation domain-containing protein
MSQRDGEAGFSMIEVLVALFIVSIALTAIYQSMTLSFRGIRAAREREEILTHATSVLELARRFDHTEAERHGRYSNGARWRIWQQPINIPMPDDDSATPSWLMFEATTASGQPIMKLRTATPR